MEENIYYKKVFIKDASDLPKEDGMYFTAKSEDRKTSGLKPIIYTAVSKKKWLKEISWYLQPIEQPEQEIERGLLKLTDFRHQKA